ncbi:MAG: sulfurtransferase, partial [Solirubrobacteraceae bacterium]
MPSPIVTAEDLQPDRVTLLDVRWQLTEGSQPDLYASGHIPSAVFVDLDRDLAAPPGARGRHPLPAPEDFEAAMRAAGVSEGTRVVAYDDANGLAGARAWWLLRYFGHGDVAVLDGGLTAWIGAGGQLAEGDE